MSDQQRSNEQRSERAIRCQASTKTALLAGRDGKTHREYLLELAEEFGRLLARQLSDKRRGYGLLELLAGVAALAIVTVLIYRWLMQ